MPDHALQLAIITLLGATINGALGYGFSSVTVPLALLFLSNRLLNPALVLLEVAMNGYTLFVNRESIPNVWRRMMPIVVGLAPGIAAGTMLVAHASADWLKLYTYATLLPLILLQAADYRRPIQSERSFSIAFGGCLGAIYSATTISGPPLAVALNNQGLARQEFRAALGIVRLAESTMTAVAYCYLGMFTSVSLRLVPMVLPSLVVGVPLGAFTIRRVPAETFRRVCMSFDAWIVAFGVSILIRKLGLVESQAVAFLVLVAVSALDACLLYRFLTVSTDSRRASLQSESATGLGASSPGCAYPVVSARHHI
jgi:uncharacterized membrane protein YfcA